VKPSPKTKAFEVAIVVFFILSFLSLIAIVATAYSTM
jgi:hypothetical protein